MSKNNYPLHFIFKMLKLYNGRAVGWCGLTLFELSVASSDAYLIVYLNKILFVIQTANQLD